MVVACLSMRVLDLPWHGKSGTKHHVIVIVGEGRETVTGATTTKGGERPGRCFPTEGMERAFVCL